MLALVTPVPGVVSDATAAGGLRGATVVLAAAAFRPSNEVFRSLYGAPQWPLSAQVEVPLDGPVFAFAGARRLAREGETLAIPPAVDDTRFPLELSVTSVRAGAGVTRQQRRGRLYAAVGAEYAQATERWPAADLSHDSQGWGVVIQAGAEAPVWGRLAARALVEYAAVHAGDDPETGEKLALGGLALGAGVSFRFGR